MLHAGETARHMLLVLGVHWRDVAGTSHTVRRSSTAHHGGVHARHAHGVWGRQHLAGRVVPVDHHAHGALRTTVGPHGALRQEHLVLVVPHVSSSDVDPR